MLVQAPVLPLNSIRAAVKSGYGLDGTYRALDGERDQNHRLSSAEGEFVVKICNPAEGLSIVEGQLLALEHIAAVDPGLGVPRVRRTPQGGLLHSFSSGGSVLPVAVLSWLKGDVAGDRDLAEAQYCELGETIGRLNKALRGFVHPAPAGRALVWNTVQAHALSGHLDLIAPGRRALVGAVLAESRALVELAAARLPAQIMHADAHPFNVLLSEEGHVSGVIDFGDMVHGPRVMELANVLADCLLPGRDFARIVTSITSGFVRHVPLEEQEVDLILPLMRSRLALTALITAIRRKDGAPVTPQIAALDSISLDILAALDTGKLGEAIRYAANFEPRPALAKDSMIARRVAAMGPKPLLFYDTPLHMVKGDGVWLTASDGRRYLDCYNNVPHVGHCNPHVSEAVARRLRVLNTNTRYLTDESIAYAERLKATLDPSLDTVVFVNSGSEANDVAYRMARCWTGQTGMLVMDFAYHGVTDISDAMSPSNYPAGKFSKPQVRQLEAPDTYRGPHRKGANGIAERYAAFADAAIAELASAGFGVAVSVLDSAFMTNGIIDAPPGYVQAIAGRTRAAGGLFVADEVQSGFGRMGTHMWGHQHQGVVPDFVTIGKPAGNGYPVGVIITRSEILEKFIAETGPFFSTFGGGNAACAAGMAVLDVIAREELVQNSLETGKYLREGFRSLMDRHELIGDVRGSGLAVGVELVRSRVTLEPAAAETRKIINALKDLGVLVGSDGKLGNVLKVRPPLIFGRAEADIAISALDDALKALR